MEMKRGARMAPPAAALAASTIKSLDSAAHTVTLDTGKVCHCDKTVDLAKFKAGDKVRMTFAEKNGKSECCAMTRAA